jgi:hypothetical protein
MSDFKKPDFHALQEKLRANYVKHGFDPVEYKELHDAFRYAEALEKELTEVARIFNINMLLESVAEKARNMQSRAYGGYPEFRTIKSNTPWPPSEAELNQKIDFTEESKREIDEQILAQARPHLIAYRNGKCTLGPGFQALKDNEMLEICIDETWMAGAAETATSGEWVFCAREFSFAGELREGTLAVRIDPLKGPQFERVATRTRGEWWKR